MLNTLFSRIYDEMESDNKSPGQSDHHTGQRAKSDEFGSVRDFASCSRVSRFGRMQLPVAKKYLGTGVSRWYLNGEMHYIASTGTFGTAT